MKFSPVRLSGPVASLASLAVVLLMAAPVAHADSYAIYNLGNANYNNIYGIDTSGQVVVEDNICSGSGMPCYTTYDKGSAVAVSFANVAPNLDWDNGSACSSLPSGFSIYRSVCNNGRIGFANGIDNPNGMHRGLYTGALSDLTYLQDGSGDKVVLNSSGDFAWVSGQQEYIYEAVDTSVPEPSSFLLFATGVIMFSSTLRRRLWA